MEEAGEGRVQERWPDSTYLLLNYRDEGTGASIVTTSAIQSRSKKRR
jgi:hypothetical protein